MVEPAEGGDEEFDEVLCFLESPVIINKLTC